MIRSRTVETYPDEDIIGLTMKTVPDRMIVEIDRDGELINDPNEPIEEDDILICMVSGVTENIRPLWYGRIRSCNPRCTWSFLP